MLYKIDLALYGIVQGSFGKPPYTTQQYTQAKANKDGVNAAIAFADANGFAGVLFPRGIYTFAYTSLTTDTVYTRGVIFPKSNQTIDLNGSTFEMMFDSVNKSPFHTSAEAAYALPGCVFLIDKVYNIVIRNGEIKGDIFNRAFSNATEKSMEQTYGVNQMRYVYNTRYENLNIYGFMGDSFTFSTRAFNSNGAVAPIGVGDATPGYIGSTGVITQVDGAYISPLVTLDLAKLKEFTPYAPNTIQIQTAGGYTRIPAFANQFLEIAFYKTGNIFISKRTVRYLEKIILPFGTVAVQMIFTGEAVGLTTLPNPGYNIMEQASNTAKIVSCKVHDNHRGGISNPCDSLTVEDCDIWHNGLDSSIGAPLFPDTTRYAINFEDTFAQDVVIKNSRIYDGYNCLLMGVNNFLIDNNIISNFNTSGVNIYNNATGVISNNKFYECPIVSFSPSVTIRKISFEHNYVFNRSQSISITSGNDKLMMKNNDIICNVLNMSGLYLDFDGNELANTPEVVFDQFKGYTIDIRSFRNNNVNGSFRLNRSSFKAATMTGTTLEGFKDIRVAMNSIDTSTAELVGVTLKSCYFAYIIGGAGLTSVPEFNVKLRGCTLIDSTIQLPGEVNLTNTITKIKLWADNCYFKISALSPFKINSNKGFSTNGIVYEHNLQYNTFEYLTTDLPLVFGSVYAQNSGLFRHRINANSIKAINNDLFLSKITIGGVV